MAIKYRMEDFNIDENTIPQDVKDLYNSWSKIRKRTLGYDFIVILYYLRFVERLERSEIAQKMGAQVVNIHERLYDLGWHYSNDYAENKILSEKELIKLQGDLLEAKEKSYFLDIDEHIKLKEAIKTAKNVRAKLYLGLGFKTGEEYVRTIYYLIQFKRFSTKNLARLFNIPISLVHDRLQALRLNRSHDEGIRNKKEQKTQNYSGSLSSGKITRAKSQFQSFSTGSKNEDYFRRQLSNMVYQYIDNEKYEVVVGLSITGILGALEIDIPTIVYDVAKNQVYRFAIEYSGNYFHTDEEDITKENLAQSKGWHYLNIVENSNNPYSNNRRLLDSIVRETCEKIKEIVQASG